jgi:cystathionine beta-lyase/cystathionine gamma-synthase
MDIILLYYFILDVVGGVVCLNDTDLYKRIKFLQNGIGSIPSPFDCFLAMRGFFVFKHVFFLFYN